MWRVVLSLATLGTSPGVRAGRQFINKIEMAMRCRGVGGGQVGAAFLAKIWQTMGTPALNAEPPAPMNHVKIFKGWPPLDAPSKLVQLWYETFPPDQRGLVEMKNITGLSNITSTA